MKWQSYRLEIGGIIFIIFSQADIQKSPCHYVFSPLHDKTWLPPDILLPSYLI